MGKPTQITIPDTLREALRKLDPQRRRNVGSFAREVLYRAVLEGLEAPDRSTISVTRQETPEAEVKPVAPQVLPAKPEERCVPPEPPAEPAPIVLRWSSSNPNEQNISKQEEYEFKTPWVLELQCISRHLSSGLAALRVQDKQIADRMLHKRGAVLVRLRSGGSVVGERLYDPYLLERVPKGFDGKPYYLHPVNPLNVRIG